MKFFAPLLAILSLIYSYVMHLRAWLYLVRVLPSDTSGAFVVSIGNVQAGGTGKTPLVDFFARRWRTKQRLGIVSRGYGRKTTGSLRVEPLKPDAAELFGDEPTWLAQSLSDGSGPMVAVQVGEKRIDAARDVIASEGVKLILLDDGFQHLALRRSFDIVLIDASVPDWHWRVLPWGRLRESLSSLKRADAIIFTKTESISAERLAQIESLVQTEEPKPLLRFEQTIHWPNPTSSESLVLAAGLARPEGFFELVKSHESKPRVLAAVSYPDHHQFNANDVDHLLTLAKKHDAKRVLVTQKDAVKLRPLWTATNSMPVELIVSSLEVRPARESDKKQLERIDEIILNEVRSNSRARVRVSDSKPSP